MRYPLRRVLPLAASALIVWGCGSGDAPTAPSPELAAGGAALSTAANPDLSRLARFQQRPAITIAWAKKWIGPEGGRLDFQGFAVEVPPGAVGRVTQFSIRLPVDPSGSERVVAEFGPHGADFVVPVRIELPYHGTTIYGDAASTVVWWSPERADWVDMGATVTADGLRLQTTTPHFSIYGTTSESRGGSVLVSGG